MTLDDWKKKTDFVLKVQEMLGTEALKKIASNNQAQKETRINACVQLKRKNVNIKIKEPIVLFFSHCLINDGMSMSFQEIADRVRKTLDFLDFLGFLGFLGFLAPLTQLFFFFCWNASPR